MNLKYFRGFKHESIGKSRKERNNHPNRQAEGNQSRGHTRNSNRKGLCKSKREKKAVFQ